MDSLCKNVREIIWKLFDNYTIFRIRVLCRLWHQESMKELENRKEKLSLQLDTVIKKRWGFSGLISNACSLKTHVLDIVVLDVKQNKVFPIGNYAVSSACTTWFCCNAIRTKRITPFVVWCDCEKVKTTIDLRKPIFQRNVNFILDNGIKERDGDNREDICEIQVKLSTCKSCHRTFGRSQAQFNCASKDCLIVKWDLLKERPCTFLKSLYVQSKI